MDLPASSDNLARFRAKVAAPIVPISCLDGKGLPELREVLWKAVREGKVPAGAKPAAVRPAAKPKAAAKPRPKVVAKAKTTAKAKPARKPVPKAKARSKKK